MIRTTVTVTATGAPNGGVPDFILPTVPELISQRNTRAISPVRIVKPYPTDVSHQSRGKLITPATNAITNRGKALMVAPIAG